MYPRAIILVFLALVVAPGMLVQSEELSEVNPFNVPDELRTCLRTRPELEFNGEVNPFYISADYDGDGLTDFAAQVTNRKDHQPGILFCLTGRRPILLGAGSSVAWPQDGRAGWPFDSWMLIRKGSKHLSIYPKIKFDALALMKADLGGGLVYWDGSQFRWQQEE